MFCMYCTCTGSCEPGSRCRLSNVHIQFWETPGGRDFGKGSIWGRGWKWGDQFTSNLGPRWTGSYHSKEGSKEVKGNERGPKKNRKGKSRKQGDCTTIASHSIFVYRMNACNV
jgi:hypothetical protein